MAIRHLGPGEKAHSIEWRELFPIAILCIALGKQFCNRQLLIHCDNESVCTIWRSGTGKSAALMSLLRVALLATAKHNVTVLVTHIKGVDNTLADCLARLQVRRFRALHPQAHPLPMQLDMSHLCRLITGPWSSSLQEWRRLRPERTKPG